jgi:hypothetical protein
MLYNEYAMIPEQYPTVFNILSSTKDKETDSSVAGLGAMVEKPEGQPIEYDDPLKGQDKTYTHLTYGIGFRVTEEMKEDDLYDKIEKIPKSMAQSARVRIETEAWNVFNNGFTDSANYLGRDGEPLFGDGTTKYHECLDGNVCYNQLPTAADIDPATIEQMLIYWRKIVNDQNQKITIKPAYILVAPEQQFMVEKILNSSAEAFTAENQTNVLKGKLKIIVGDYLTDTNACIFLSDKSNHTLNFFWRRKLTMKGSDDFDTGDSKFKSTMRFSVGYTDWRGVFGNPGL